MTTELLKSQEAAEYLGVSIRCLEDYHRRGTGPLFVKVGRNVRYHRTALAQWIERHTYSNTAQTRAIA